MRSSAPAYHRVGSLIWDEPWDDDTRMVAFFVLTGPYRVTEGLFRFKLPHAAIDLNWPLKRFRRAFDALCAAGFVEYDFDAQVVLIVKALRWQAPQNPNQVKAAIRALEQLPPTPLLTRLRETAAEFAAADVKKGRRFHEALEDRFGQPIANGSGNGYSNGSANGSGNPSRTLLAPTPAPTPEAPPTPPRGGRQRDKDSFAEQMDAWVASHFPGVAKGYITTAISQLRSRRIEPTAEAVRPLVAQWVDIP